ncbi:MAG: phosphatidate cytidylyltransferase [Bacteroidaceae bacterium]|nr:phosphatidate cytidylyltransferase [Bacteroidaceae bacterium]
MKNLVVRTLTGIVFLAVMISGILYSPATFGVLFTVITAFCLWEFTGIVNMRTDVDVNRFITTVAGCCLFVGFFGYAAGIPGGVLLFIPWLLSMIYMLVAELYLKREVPMNNWAYAMMAQIYVALPFALLALVEFASLIPADAGTSTSAVGAWLVLAIYVFLWINDTGAYCVGSLLGRHKLFPRVSPGKSWEGSIGGGVLAVAVAVAVALLGPKDSIDAAAATVLGMTAPQWAGFALTVVVFGTWGDLIESLFKRQMGIKDSGNILPGHGGMLDRFDSSLLAIPAAVIYLYMAVLL